MRFLCQLPGTRGRTPPGSSASRLRQNVLGALVVFSWLLAGDIPLAAAPAQERPCVLVIHSYHEGMPWTAGVSAGLRDQLESAELVTVFLDVKRFPSPAHEAFHLAVVSQGVAVARPAVIVTIDDYAYDFVLRHRAQIGPQLPVIFGGLNSWSDRRPPGVTGVQEAFDLAATLRLALALHQDARRVVVVNDNSETGRANRTALEQA